MKITINKNSLFDNTIIFLLYWITIQDFFLGFLFHATHLQGEIKIIFFTKDILLVALFLKALLKKQKQTSLFIIEFMYLFLIIIYSLFSFIGDGIGITSLLSSVRGLIICPMFLTIGKEIDNKEYFKDFIINKYFKYLFILAMIGIVEYCLDSIVGTKTFWTNVIGIGDFYTNIKGADISTTHIGLPGNFYGYSAMGIFTRKRLVSIWGNPLTSAYSLLIPLNYYMIVLYQKLRTKSNDLFKTLIIFFVFFIAILLTYTRAIILGFLIGFSIFIIYVNKNRFYNIISLFVMAIIGTFIFFTIKGLDSIYSFIYDGSTIGHINALINSISNMSFFGSGIGLFGAAGGLQSTESSYFAIMGQIGVIGIILYLQLLYVALKYCYKLIRTKEVFPLFIFLTFVILLITGFISEQLMSYSSIALAYILLGFLQGTAINNKSGWTK